MHRDSHLPVAQISYQRNDHETFTVGLWDLPKQRGSCFGNL